MPLPGPPQRLDLALVGMHQLPDLLAGRQLLRRPRRRCALRARARIRLLRLLPAVLLLPLLSRALYPLLLLGLHVPLPFPALLLPPLLLGAMSGTARLCSGAPPRQGGPNAFDQRAYVFLRDLPGTAGHLLGQRHLVAVGGGRGRRVACRCVAAPRAEAARGDAARGHVLRHQRVVVYRPADALLQHLLHARHPYVLLTCKALP
mmetsp:Transcript_18737/g.41710  ORF Transcript_18737/g.41710 Transcript_18737/m.41710 type:complete len:204 (-) Transcript_18737:993-1604(-)